MSRRNSGYFVSHPVSILLKLHRSYRHTDKNEQDQSVPDNGQDAKLMQLSHE